MIEYNLKNKTIDEKLEIIKEIENTDSITENDLNILEVLSQESDAEIRVRVAKILVRSNAFASEKILITLLKDKSDLVRVNACDSLSISNSIEVINLLKERIQKDKNSLVRGYAALSIVDVAINTNYNFEELSLFLRQVLKKEKISWVKINIYKALYLLGNELYLDLLIQEINNRLYRNRCAVANLLADLVSEKNLSTKVIKKIRLGLNTRMKIESSPATKSSIENALNAIKVYY